MITLEAINSQNITVGVIGLGYVGLPLSRVFVETGFKVIGFDIDESQVNLLNQAKSYIKHIPDNVIDEMNQKGFEATLDFSKIEQVDVIIICVPTPLTKYREPDLVPIIETGKSILPYLKKGQLVILESSTFPGTTDEELAGILESTGLKKDIDFYLAYSPEREDPGNLDFNTATIPKVVGADTQKSRELAVSLYEQVVSEVIPVSSSRTAEAIKLTENTFRSVNIALSNELKIIFDAMNIDVWEVIDGASTKPFGFMAHYPGPGLGGHCIPIDPFYLTYKAREFDVPTRFVELAGEINMHMPNYVISKLTESLSKHSQKSVKGAKILIIGLAYKKDVDDLRESPSLVLMEKLETLGAEVDFHDEFCPSIPLTRDHSELLGRESVPLNENLLKEFDMVLISTNHSYIDYQLLANHSHIIIDTRNAMKGYTGKAIIIKA